MNRTRQRNSGFLLTEMIVAAALFGLIMAALASSLYALSRFNHYQLINQRCIAAAQAQLDSMTATRQLIPHDDFQRLWPKLTISMETSPGTGQWQGMNLAKITAAGKSYRKQVKVQLSRYVPHIPATEKTTETNSPPEEDS